MAPHIAEGDYTARAVSAALGETSTGKEQVAVECVLLDSEDTEGPRITWYGYFTDAALPFTLAALRTFGWRGVDLEDLSGIEGNPVQLVIRHEEYNGKTTAKVRFVNDVNGGGGLKAPLSSDKARAFAAKMKASILAFDQSNALPKANGAPKAAVKPKAKPVLSPEPPPHTDADGMPF